MKSLFYFAISALVLTSCAQNESKEPSTEKIANQEKPNILLLVGDDIAFGDLGIYGSEIKTPNFERLADAGVRFLIFMLHPFVL